MKSNHNHTSKILIVDDEQSVCLSLSEILKAEFSVLIANSARQALEVIKNNSHDNNCKIDLVLSDIFMSEIDGIELLRRVKERNPEVEMIMITGHPNPQTTISALKFGARDYITKPFQIPEVLESVKKAMDKRRESVKIERLIEDLKVAIQKNYEATTEALILAIDAKDNYTKEHCSRVAKVLVEFAQRLGLDSQRQELLKKVAMLHDIGKIGVREQVLNKPGRLDPAEWEEIKQHSIIGYRIVQPVEFLGEGRKIMLYHQERFDGKGYPEGLKGTKIPLGSRMLAIVDSYDAMSTDRPYRKKLSTQQILAELEGNAGTQFDPKLVKVFVKMLKEKFP